MAAWNVKANIKIDRCKKLLEVIYQRRNTMNVDDFYKSIIFYINLNKIYFYYSNNKLSYKFKQNLSYLLIISY
jgi:hypothetical protein